MCKTIADVTGNAYKRYLRDPSFNYSLIVKDEAEQARTNIKKHIRQKVSKKLSK